MPPPLIDLLIGLQTFVVAFIALHDWVPLGRLSDLSAVHAADSRARLVIVTLLSTLPFAVGLTETVAHAERLPGWLMIYLWISYGLLAMGALRAWWIPYLLVEDARRSARYQAMFGRTHGFLPVHNGIRPNTLHVVLHLVILAVIAVLAVMSISART